MAVTRPPIIRSGSFPSRTVKSRTVKPPMSSKVADWACQSARLGGEAYMYGSFRSSLRSHRSARRSADGNGSERSRTPSTTLKMVVLAPMPSPRVSTATVVNAGQRRNVRSA